jgi:hypothetical protein
MSIILAPPSGGGEDSGSGDGGLEDQDRLEVVLIVKQLYNYG